MKDKDSKAIVLKVLFWVMVVIILVFNLFPFLYALVSSFRPSQELFSTQIIPRSLTIDHYQAVFADPRFVKSLVNSIIIAGVTVLIALGLGSLCAYALGRLPFRYKGSVLYLVLTMTMFPQIAVLSGLFVMLKDIGTFQHTAGSHTYLFDLLDAFYNMGDDAVFSQPAEGTRGSCLR